MPTFSSLRHLLLAALFALLDGCASSPISMASAMLPTACCSTPAAPNSLTKHALIGYWHNFPNESGAAFPLREVAPEWDVVVIAFGDDGGHGSVRFALDPSAGSTAQFIADIGQLHRHGKKVVLSLGGQDGAVSLDSASDVDHFVSSVTALMEQYGFDGIDLDLERGVTLGSPIQHNLVDAVRQLQAHFGHDFYLSMAPEHPYVQGGFDGNSTYRPEIRSAYLPIIDGLRDILTVLHVQYYNNGSFVTPYSAHPVEEGSVDGLVAASRMLIEGFAVAGANRGFFRGLRPDQVAIGVPSGRSSANLGFVSTATVAAALDCLTRSHHCGSIAVPHPFPDFRGVMTWSINWDRHDGYPFSKEVGTALRQLP